MVTDKVLELLKRLHIEDFNVVGKNLRINSSKPISLKPRDIVLFKQLPYSLIFNCRVELDNFNDLTFLNKTKSCEELYLSAHSKLTLDYLPITNRLSIAYYPSNVANNTEKIRLNHKIINQPSLYLKDMDLGDSISSLKSDLISIVDCKFNTASVSGTDSMGIQGTYFNHLDISGYESVDINPTDTCNNKIIITNVRNFNLNTDFSSRYNNYTKLKINNCRNCFIPEVSMLSSGSILNVENLALSAHSEDEVLEKIFMPNVKIICKRVCMNNQFNPLDRELFNNHNTISII